MAIRPVDLQLAYLAAPQNAAVVSSAQEAPQAAAQAAQAAFAAELVRREESIEEAAHIEGAKVRARRERQPEERGQSEPDRGRPTPDEAPAGNSNVLGLAAEGDHFIDVTA
jgi:hypothetical protein